MVRGHQVLLGHPERCPAFQRAPRVVGRLVRDGALVQVTAGAFAGRFGRSAQRLATRLAADGLVHVVASDAHDLVARPPGMRADLENAGLGAHAARWTEDVPAAVLAGDSIPCPPATRRRRWRVLR
jgi:protein-tyrosine phosphatase